MAMTTDLCIECGIRPRAVFGRGERVMPRCMECYRIYNRNRNRGYAEQNKERRLTVAQEVIAEAVLAATERIKTRLTSMGQDAVSIGMDLQIVKDGLAHGEWLPWLDTNFGMSATHAERFIQIAQAASANSTSMLNLSATVQMLLVAPRLESEVRDEVVEGIVEGEIAPTARAVDKAIKEATAKLKAERDKLKQGLTDAQRKQESAEAITRETLERAKRAEADAKQAVEDAAKRVSEAEAKLKERPTDKETVALIDMLRSQGKKAETALKKTQDELADLRRRFDDPQDVMAQSAKWKKVSTALLNAVDSMIAQCPPYADARLFDERAVGLLDGMLAKLRLAVTAYETALGIHENVVDAPTRAPMILEHGRGA